MIQPYHLSDLDELLAGRRVLVIRSADVELFCQTVDRLLTNAPRARVSLLVPPGLRASGRLDAFRRLDEVFAGGYDPWDRLSRNTVGKVPALEARRFDFAVLVFERPLGDGLEREARLARAIAPHTLIVTSRGRLFVVDRFGFRSLAIRRWIARVVVPASLFTFSIVSFLPALLASVTGLYNPLRPLRLKR